MIWPTKTDVLISSHTSNDEFTFNNVQNQPGVPKWVEVDHVTQRAVCQSRTEHWNVILKTGYSMFTDSSIERNTMSCT